MNPNNLSWPLPMVATLLLCAGVPVLAAGKADPRLDGDWQIDAAASDNFDARLQRMAEELRAKRRNRRGGMGGLADGADRAGQAAATNTARCPAWWMNCRPNRATSCATAWARPSARPRTCISRRVGDEIVMRGDAPPERRFRLLETVTRMDVSGTSTISTRWSGSALLVAFALHQPRPQRAALRRRPHRHGS